MMQACCLLLLLQEGQVASPVAQNPQQPQSDLDHVKAKAMCALVRLFACSAAPAARSASSLAWLVGSEAGKATGALIGKGITKGLNFAKGLLNKDNNEEQPGAGAGGAANA